MRRGQPPKPLESVASSHLHIRVTAQQKAELTRRANDAGMTMSAFILFTMGVR